MKKFIYAILVLSAFSAQVQAETRCGWVFDEQTGNSLYLVDAQGSWLLFERGGHSADFMADFPSSREVITIDNGDKVSCVCMDVDSSVNKYENYINVVRSAYSKPLQACYQDRKLKRPF